MFNAVNWSHQYKKQLPMLVCDLCVCFQGSRLNLIRLSNLKEPHERMWRMRFSIEGVSDFTMISSSGRGSGSSTSRGSCAAPCKTVQTRCDRANWVFPVSAKLTMCLEQRPRQRQQQQLGKLCCTVQDRANKLIVFSFNHLIV